LHAPLKLIKMHRLDLFFGFIQSIFRKTKSIYLYIYIYIYIWISLASNWLEWKSLQPTKWHLIFLLKRFEGDYFLHVSLDSIYCVFWSFINSQLTFTTFEKKYQFKCLHMSLDSMKRDFNEPLFNLPKDI
jgi:hypothetical protein